ncbi:hypothetical protein [Micromonospora sp. HUAS LYJ1]|uniref:hypothetical protein n=1 Tax=Micromonospora sp. HUAS LYJ1 TaxID=3061626 RepID=UPI0026726C29|nr:hypothetical protein [Micromonospora sp. HUAS LYJ1]WKU07116.1 hypothetical protein Q2K16_08720 [Micromonospora sp. HUAS LYJ1]
MMTVDYQARHRVPPTPGHQAANGRALPARLSGPPRRLVGVCWPAANWYAIGIAGLISGSRLPTIGDACAVFVLSSASLLFGLWVYWRHGGPLVTGVGIYNFAFAIFVGFAGLYLLFSDLPRDDLIPALAWCYFGQVTTWLLFWTQGPPPQPARVKAPDVGYLRRITWWGLVVTCGAAPVSLALVGSMRQLGQAAGFVGTVLIAIGLLSDKRRPPLWGCLLGAGGFALSVATSNSYARMTLVSLAFALVVVVSRRLGTRVVKAATILSAAPLLWALGDMRKEAVQAQRPGTLINATGLESVVSPLESFVKLLHLDAARDLAYAWGDTFAVAVVSLVPRALWPSKPPGFGAELMLMLHPELANSGHSDAALFQGEWLYNFGILGLALMMPVVGIGVWAADRFLMRAAVLSPGSRWALLGYGSAVVIVASLPDLTWGTFTFAVRVGMRLAVLVVVSVLITNRRIE